MDLTHTLAGRFVFIPGACLRVQEGIINALCHLCHSGNGEGGEVLPFKPSSESQKKKNILEFSSFEEKNLKTNEGIKYLV